MFQIISKCLINGLRAFIYNNTYELWNIIKYKEKRGTIMPNKCYVLCERVIDVFREKFTSPLFKNCRFILLMLILLVQWNVGKLEMIFTMIMYKNIYITLMGVYTKKSVFVFKSGHRAQIACSL